MADNRFAEWMHDTDLASQMKEYTKQGFTRKEMLDYLREMFPQYPWSVRSLDRRLRFFNIYKNESDIKMEDVKAAVEQELEGPGKLLGYRLLHKKIRQRYDLLCTREQVYHVMCETDPEGLAARGNVGQRRKKKKGNFTSLGSNWVHSLDGHDKLMGYQNSTFPIAVYGCIDTASRKVLWIHVWTNNSDPQLIGRWYLEYALNKNGACHDKG